MLRMKPPNEGVRLRVGGAQRVQWEIMSTDHNPVQVITAHPPPSPPLPFTPFTPSPSHSFSLPEEEVFASFFTVEVAKMTVLKILHCLFARQQDHLLVPR